MIGRLHLTWPLIKYSSFLWYMQDKGSFVHWGLVTTLNVQSGKYFLNTKKRQLSVIWRCSFVVFLSIELENSSTNAPMLRGAQWGVFFSSSSLWGLHLWQQCGGVKLVKRMAERLRQQMDNKRDVGGLPLRPVLPFILVISPVQLGRGWSGTPHKGLSVRLREHLFPKPFMFIGTSAA